MIPMTLRVATKHEIPPSSFQHPRIRSGVESSFFEDLDPGQSFSPQAPRLKPAGTSSSGEHPGVTDCGISWKSMAKICYFHGNSQTH